MESLNTPATLAKFTERINKLKPDSPRQWGKMSVAQMLAHCCNALETNLGDKEGKRGIMAMIFGRLAKKSVTSLQPFKQGLPTDPSFMVTDDRDFNKEKERLIKLLNRLSASDPHVLAQNKHPFFGQMTAEEWNTLNYKHLDHHLRQFGV
jgi:hypothetical protein